MAPAGDTITTLAGGIGKPPLATQLALGDLGSCSVQFSAGHLYVADEFVVRAVNPRTDAVTTPAGIGSDGFNGDNIPATKAELDGSCGGTVDGAGNLVIAVNGRVRVVAAKTGTFYGQHMIAGDIYTVASDDGAVCSGGHKPGSSFCPADVITDPKGNILVANAGTTQLRAHRVAQIIALPERSGTFYGKKMVAGKRYVLANAAADQIAVDHAGNILMAADTRVKVLAEATGRFYGLAMKRGNTYTIAGNGTPKPSGDGGPARKAGLNAALGVAVDHSGNVVIADTFVGHLKVVAVRTGTFYGQHMRAGDIYPIAGVRKGPTGNGVPAAKASVGDPQSAEIDGQGNVVFDDGLFTVRAIAERTGTFYGQHMKAGDVYTVAGNRKLIPYAGEGGPATSVQGVAGGLAVDAAGNLVIANRVIRVVAASTATFYGKAMTKGHIYTIAGSGTGDTGGTAVGDGGPASTAKLGATDVAVDADGNLVVTEAAGHRVRVVATHTGTFYGQPMTAGDIYTVAGDGARGFSGDGGPAVDAKISVPAGVTVDAAGNLVFVDSDTDEGRGAIQVVAAATGTFYGQPMTAGDIYIIAGCQCGKANDGNGGPALAATFLFVGFGGADQLTFDANGNLVVASDGLIWVIAESTGAFYGQAMTAGDAYAVAGNGTGNSFANGVPATSSGVDAGGVAVDGNGNLIIGDAGNHEVRVVAATTGTSYGVPMTAGDIYAIAGRHQVGLSGDGGPSTAALLCSPTWIVVHDGNLIFSDSCDGRIREIQGGP